VGRLGFIFNNHKHHVLWLELVRHGGYFDGDGYIRKRRESLYKLIE